MYGSHSMSADCAPSKECADESKERNQGRNRRNTARRRVSLIVLGIELLLPP